MPYDGSDIPREFIDQLLAIRGNKVALRYLTADIDEVGVTLVMTSRISVPAGFPVWSEFLKDLRGEYGVAPDENVRERVGERRFLDLVEDTYGFLNSEPPTWSGAIRLLPYLSDRIVTSSLDNALEAMYGHVGVPFGSKFVAGSAPSIPSSRWIWKLRGTAEDRSSIVADLKSWPGASATGIGVVLFVGLQDLELDSAELKGDFGDSSGFMILPESTSISADVSDRVRVIRCPRFQNAGEELLLRYLIAQTPNGKRPIPPMPLSLFSASAPPVAKAVEPAPELPPLKMPEDLVESCRAGECVLFAGAGLSARAGVPTWNEMLAGLIGFARDRGVIDASYASSLESALAEGDRDSTADGLVQAFGTRRDLLQEFLRASFPSSTNPATAHEILQQISFSAIVTTNYDRLLEDTFPEYAQSAPLTPKDAEALLDALSQKRKFLLKLYGVIDKPETLIMAPIEYKEVLNSNISFSKFMEGFFYSRTFFFAGLSLEGIQDFLSGFIFRGSSPKKHFALVAVSGSGWRAKAEFLLRRYNVQVIPFAVSEDFPEVDQFVEEFLHAVRPVTPHLHEPQKEVMPGLRKLLLEDIGSFERLELEFPKSSTWKVLLGDNGTGKSTILKAIAVAIMGSDARSYAARLVRAGKTRGRITLCTEHNPSGYVTEILVKDMVSEAEVVSFPSRPMEAEGWLALGFSPLRVVTWTPASGPQPMITKGRPTSDDLLPLISGETDPRMDRLKQWIVNLDAADKSGQGKPLTGHSARVSSLAFAADGVTLVSGSIDKTVRLWNAETTSATSVLEGHVSGVNAVAVSADGKRVLSGAYDKTVRAWMLRSASTPRLVLRGSKSQILSTCIAPDGAFGISGSEASIRIWDLATGIESRRIDAGSGPIWGLALSPTCDRLAAACDAGYVAIYDPSTGALISRLTQSAGAVRNVAWSASGSRIVSGHIDGMVAVWDTASWECVRVLEGNSDARTMCVAISSDGKVAAAGSDAGMLKMWEMETGKELMRVQAHTGPIWSMAFGGSTLATGSEDGTIRLWKVPEPTALETNHEAIRRFFRVVSVLTDRQDIEFLKVENFRVLIKIDSAREGVPLEVLSQGLTSLLGWVGILCQRLKETLDRPTHDPLPTNSYALVLIDELDAHMHPKWQQVLVHRLKKVFPHVQFIASTHSPLIVGGLKKEEVDRFASVDGTIAKVDFDSDMTRGRTDQILTGELFELENTFDPETQELMQKYEGLLGKSERTAEEQKEFLELGDVLETRIPAMPSNLLERRAQELLEAVYASNPEEPSVIESAGRLAKALRREGLGQ